MARISAWIWMVLILNTMFQSCFQAEATGAIDPINSFSELVMESLLGVSDGFETDEHGTEEHELKLSSSLHWKCDWVASLLPLVEARSVRVLMCAPNKVLLNLNGEVLLPPPDLRTA